MALAQDETSVIVWEGYLKKKSPTGAVKVWQKRYFRLLGDVLEYYKSDNLGACAGMVPIQLMQSIRLHPPSKKGGCRFDIMLSGMYGALHHRVFCLLAPTPQLASKLVRSLRNMLHTPMDESIRMDMSGLDLGGSFWKRIDDLERRRAGASKKVDAAAQFAGFDIQPKRRRKNNHHANQAEEAAAGSGTKAGTTSMNTTGETVDKPSFRLLKQLPVPALGRLYLARDMFNNECFLLHAMWKPVTDALVATMAGIPVHSQEEAERMKADLEETKHAWHFASQLYHPFMITPANGGECSDACWRIYRYNHHATLEFHLAALLKQQYDARRLFGEYDADDDGFASHPHQLLPLEVIRFLTTELVALLEFAHSVGLVLWNLDTEHLALSEEGHVELRDLFLAEQHDAMPVGREIKPEELCTPEFIRGEVEDYRSDYWRLGLIIYQLIVGHLPPGIIADPSMRRTEKRGRRNGRNHEEHIEWEMKQKEDAELESDSSPHLPLDIADRVSQFDATHEESLPFPPTIPEAWRELVRSLLVSDRHLRLGHVHVDNSVKVHVIPQDSSNGQPTQTGASSSSFYSAEMKQASIEQLMAHPAMEGVDWDRMRQDIYAARQRLAHPSSSSNHTSSLLPSSTRSTAPPFTAPDSVFASLLYASHHTPFIRSTLAVPTRSTRSNATPTSHHPPSSSSSLSSSSQYRLRVRIGCGREFRIADMENENNTGMDAVPYDGQGQGLMSHAAASSSRSSLPSPFAPSGSSSSSAAHLSTTPSTADRRPLYVKFLCDGRVLKSSSVLRGSRHISPSLVAATAWEWNEEMEFLFGDEEALAVGMEGECVARVMAQDTESFHDATLGSATIPLSHIVYACQAMQSDQPVVEGQTIGDSPSSSPTPMMEGWYTVLDRSGNFFGELHLSFHLSLVNPANDDGAASSGTSANTNTNCNTTTKFVRNNRRRFSMLFGSGFSSTEDIVPKLCTPSADVHEFLEKRQMVPVDKHGRMLFDPDEQDDKQVDIVHDTSLSYVPRRALGNILTLPVRSRILAGGGGFTHTGNAHTSAPPIQDDSIHASNADMPPVDDEDDDDDDAEENQARVSNAHAPSSPTLAASAAASSSDAIAAPIVGGGGSSSGGGVGAARLLRGLVSKKKQRFQESGFDLDLSYIGERIIALGYPSEGSEAAYRNPMSEVQRFFRTFHPGAQRYKIYNLCSERKYAWDKFEQLDGARGLVGEVPFDDHNPPPFHRILDFCMDAKHFLEAHPHNVVAIHCKAGKGRTGTMISCLLMFCGLCSHSDAALSFFARARTYNGSGVTIPSQRRYVHYFHEFLTSYMDVNRPFRWDGVPVLLKYLRFGPLSLSVAKNDLSFVILQGGGRIVFDSNYYMKTLKGGMGSRSSTAMGVFGAGDHGASGNGGDGGSSNSAAGAISNSTGSGASSSSSTTLIDFKCFTPLRGDCKFIFTLGKSSKICWFWLHTSFISFDDSDVHASLNQCVLSLSKAEVDKAVKDKECKTFPQNFKIQLFFKRAPETNALMEEQSDDNVDDDESESSASEPERSGNEADDIDEKESKGEDSRDSESDDDHASYSSTMPSYLRSALSHAGRICRAHEHAINEDWQAEQDEAALLFEPEPAP